MSRLVLALVLLLAAPLSQAAGLPAFEVTPAAQGGQHFSLSIETLLFLSSLTLLPAALLLMTAFTRIIIVLALLRQALGLMQTPPNQVLVGLALFMTFFVMGPTFDKVKAQALTPWMENRISYTEALSRGSQPLKTFMLAQTRKSELARFAKMAHSGPYASAADVPLRVLVPAFVTAELKTAFTIGFLIFLPFLVIDLVVAAILMGMGMMMVSPVTVSLPIKLLLFVLVDGWGLLMSSLLQSFNP